MLIDVVTLFPDMVRVPLGISMVAKAQQIGALEVRVHNLREWGVGRHHTTDDAPFGGGPGMVMKPEPWVRAVEYLQASPPPGQVLLMSPRGRRLDQDLAVELSGQPRLVVLCGHYEGIDERVASLLGPQEISIGDFVLSGGEFAALVVVDAVARLLPGVLAAGSAAEESHTTGLLEYPHFTRPRCFRGLAVPDVLLSGNHEAIRRWRLAQSLLVTRQRRPDLLDRRQMSVDEARLLADVTGDTGQADGPTVCPGR